MSRQNLEKSALQTFLSDCEEGNLGAIKELSLSDCAELLRESDSQGRLGIHIAAARGHFSLIEYFISQVTPNISDAATPAIAIENGHLNIARFILGKDKRSLAPIFYNACESGQADVVKALLEDHSPDLLHIPNEAGWFPVHAAVEKGQLSVVKCLYEHDPSLMELAQSNEFGRFPFYEACRFGHIDIVEYLLSKKEFAHWHQPNKKGCFPVHTAVMLGRFEVVRYLVDRYPEVLDLLENEQESNSLFHLACNNGLLEIVVYLLSKKEFAHWHQLNKKGCFPIHAAVIGGRLAVVQYLLESYPELLELLNRDSLEGSLFSEACRFGHLEIVKYLLTKKTFDQWNKLDREGFFPIQLVVARGHLTVLQHLIDTQPGLIDFSVPDEWGNSLFHEACGFGQLEMIEYLLTKKSFDQWNKPNKKGSFPINVAIIEERLAVVQRLVNSYPQLLDLLEEDEIADSLFYQACRFGHLQVIEYLLTKKSFDQWNKPNNKGYFPVHTAVRSGYLAVVQRLISSCPQLLDLLEEDESERSLFHEACRYGQLEIIEYLLTKKSFDQWNKPDKKGFFPIHLAVEANNLAIVKILLAADPSVSTQTCVGKRTAFYLTCEKGFVEIASFLAKENPGVVKVPNASDQYPVHQAIQNGHLPIVKLIIAADEAALQRITPALENRDEYGQLSLKHYAIKPADNVPYSELASPPLFDSLEAAIDGKHWQMVQYFVFELKVIFLQPKGVNTIIFFGPDRILLDQIKKFFTDAPEIILPGLLGKKTFMHLPKSWDLGKLHQQYLMFCHEEILPCVKDEVVGDNVFLALLNLARAQCAFKQAFTVKIAISENYDVYPNSLFFVVTLVAKKLWAFRRTAKNAIACVDDKPVSHKFIQLPDVIIDMIFSFLIDCTVPHASLPRIVFTAMLPPPGQAAEEKMLEPETSLIAKANFFTRAAKLLEDDNKKRKGDEEEKKESAKRSRKAPRGTKRESSLAAPSPEDEEDKKTKNRR